MMLTEKLGFQIAYIAISFCFIKAYSIKLRVTPSASEKQNQHISKENAEINDFCFFEVFFFWIIGGKRGRGE